MLIHSYSYTDFRKKLAKLKTSRSKKKEDTNKRLLCMSQHVSVPGRDSAPQERECGGAFLGFRKMLYDKNALRIKIPP